MCTYYHASNMALSAGQSYSIDDFDGECTYDHINRPGFQQLINVQMDSARPEGVPSRTKCIYLFGNLLHCLAYARSNNMAHIYEVRVDGNVFGPYPMTLITTVYNCPIETRPDVIREYWHPFHDWKVFEYITNSIIVVREIPIENRYNNIDDYIDDRLMSHRIFN